MRPGPPDEHGAVLLEIARGTLAECFGGPAVATPDEAWLREPRAVFVTMTKQGQLRGCVGQLAARLPLVDAVKAAAKAAAFEDSRFPPLQADEFDQVHLEVSVLSPLVASPR
jgi:AmmeMemoRadiSam system protein A